MALQKQKTKGKAALIPLYPYQKCWIEDSTRFKLWVKSRDIGATFGDALGVVDKRIALPGLTVWVSAAERQSKEAIEIIQDHAEVAKKALDYEEIEFPGTEDKALQVTFKHNRARVMALPANPSTIRSFKGDVVLDEFAFHRDPMKIWRAVLGIMSRGYSLDVISTPNARQGKFWDMAQAAGVDPLGGMAKTHWHAGRWSVHWCDLASAVKLGCPIDATALREAADDEDTWLQEYCCHFLADAENYIPLELILSCESEAVGVDFFSASPPQGSLYLGMDIGRKKDRTVIWVVEKLGDVCWTRHLTTLERTPYHAQLALVDSLLPFMQRAAIDATGIGAMLAEEAQRKHGAKVEAVEFNIANKESMATLTRRHFEERLVRIPYDAQIRRSLNAVKRYTSPTGHFRFDAARTDQGHADEFWALALALSAASGPAISTEYLSAGRLNAGALMGGSSGIGRQLRAGW